MKAIKESSIYLVGELVSKSMPFLLLPYLSRKLGVEGFGELSYLQAYINVFFIILSLSQDGAVARYFYFYGKRNLKIVVIVGYSYSIFMGGIFSLIAYFLDSEIIIYIIFIAVFQSFLSVQLSFNQCQRKVISYVILQVANSLFLLILTVLILEISDGNLVKERIFAILLANILTCIVSYFLYVRGNSYKYSFNSRIFKLYLKYIIDFGGPLLLHHLSLFMKGQIDRVFIYHKFTEAELGLYSMGVQLASILGVLIMAINKAMIPHLFEKLKNKKVNQRYLYRLIFLFFLTFPAIFTILYYIPESIYLIFLGYGFQGIKYYFFLFMISTLLSIPYLILVNYLFYYGKNRLISICSLISMIFYIFSLVFFIDIDIKLVPYSSIIASLIVIICLYFASRKIGGYI